VLLEPIPLLVLNLAQPVRIPTVLIVLLKTHVRHVRMALVSLSIRNVALVQTIMKTVFLAVDIFVDNAHNVLKVTLFPRRVFVSQILLLKSSKVQL